MAFEELSVQAGAAPARGGTAIYIQGDERRAKDPLVLPKTASDDLSNDSVVVNRQRECCLHLLKGK
jgi:hypothetical protein